jgi:D-3-phosphoglycerate dehydrogenase / 2-oxoglutarate reductase
MPKQKFLVTDLVPKGCIDTLEGLGFAVDHIEDLSNEHLKKIIGEYQGLVVRTSLIMNPEMLDAASELKYILRPGSGMDNIDVPYAEGKGIILFNSPEANKDSVAEHVIGLLLGLMNFIPRANEQVHQGAWIRKPNTGTLLKGKTVGIIGFGHTGSALAQKLSGFEVHILAHDKYKSGFGTHDVTEATLQQILDQADVVSFHLPLTNALIARFRKNVYLINTSRGKIADTGAITRALQSGKLSGAGLDVLENENLKSYTEAEHKQLEELCLAGNVIITPHIAGWTHESRDAIFYQVLDKFRAYYEGLNKQKDSKKV